MKEAIKTSCTAVVLLYCFLFLKCCGKTYAVVIDITKYQNPALPALQYSDKDAGLFMAHLQSKAGGSISQSNP